MIEFEMVSDSISIATVYIIRDITQNKKSSIIEILSEVESMFFERYDFNIQSRALLRFPHMEKVIN